MTKHLGRPNFMWQMLQLFKYFDPLKPIVLECDVSGTGIRGTLQDGQPIMFVSQALTETQKRYSNVEHELLTVVVIIEHLHHFVLDIDLLSTLTTPHWSIYSKSVLMTLLYAYNGYC